VRTCVGCRRAVSVAELVRATLTGKTPESGGSRLEWSGIVRRGQGGRGASIHPREGCVRAAVKSHAWSRVFRAPVAGMGVDDVPAILAEITVAYERNLRRNG
jgi:predicted RNA-binding protein YlxR (DUF448 family)